MNKINDFSDLVSDVSDVFSPENRSQIEQIERELSEEELLANLKQDKPDDKDDKAAPKLSQKWLFVIAGVALAGMIGYGIYQGQKKKRLTEPEAQADEAAKSRKGKKEDKVPERSAKAPLAPASDD